MVKGGGDRTSEKVRALLSVTDRSAQPTHSTRNEIAKGADVSTGQVAMAEQVKAQQGKQTDLTLDKKLSDVPKDEHSDKTCVELMIKPPTKEFVGSDFEAIQFVMRTNKRRNLSSAQWATIGVEAEEVMGAIAEVTDEERRKMQAISLRETNAQKVTKAVDFMNSVCNKELLQTQKRDPNEKATATKAAEIFGTNRTYINQAANIRKASPDVFDKVKAGTMTMQVRRPPQPDRRSGEYLAGA